jgi:hypothetical protein
VVDELIKCLQGSGLEALAVVIWSFIDVGARWGPVTRSRV